MTTTDNTVSVITEYDERGNLSHRVGADGYEVWMEYDENDLEIHFRSSLGGDLGVELWWEYDERGNMIHHRKDNGFQLWLEYDEDNTVIRRRRSDGVVDTPQKAKP